MPQWKHEIRLRLAGLKLEPTREAEIVEELAQHLEQRYEELLLHGATDNEACGAALLELSDSNLLARELQRVERIARQETMAPGAPGRRNMSGDLWQDLRYGVRMLRKNPGFTAVVVFTLALGIGVNTAIFTMCDLSFRPLPVKDPDTIVQLRRGPERTRFSFPDYSYYRDHAQMFSGLIAFADDRLVLRGRAASEEPRQIDGTFVSDNFFSLLGAGTALGRSFTPEENSSRSRERVVILSYAFWQGQFGADPNILGETLWLNGKSFVVAGVTARDFVGTGWGLRIPDVWLPLMVRGEVPPQDTDWFSTRSLQWVIVFGRLNAGRTLNEARAEMTGLFSQLTRAYPETDPKDRVSLFRGNLTGQETGQALADTAIVLVAAGIVLLIACFNIANLLIARAAARRKEIGVRLCLGASRGRLIRQLLTESFLLAILGGGAGLLLAWWSLKISIPLWVTGRDIIALNLDPDVRVLTYTFVISLLTALAFGLLPALRATRDDLTSTLKDEGASFGQRKARSSLRNGLVVAQVALSLVLLIAAGLLLRGLSRIRGINPGFETRKVLALDLKLGAAGYDQARARQFYQDLAARLEALPGVQSVSRVSRFPFSGANATRITLKEESEAVAGQSRSAAYLAVTPGYFDTVGLPIVRGRRFTEEEMRAGAAVVVVSESTARRLWPDHGPIGRRVRAEPDGPFSLIIGVARDAQTSRVGEIDPLFLYVPFQPRHYNRELGVLMRTSGDAREIASGAQAEARALDPTPWVTTYSLEERIANSESVNITRVASMLSAGLGLLALVLAAVGIYGVMSYAVSTRTHEIGIRMAVGAQKTDVLKLVIRQGLALALIGMSIGSLAALALTRLLKSLLFGVSASDPLTYVGVGVLFAGVALVACYLPARRATKVDPMVALRYE